LADWLISLFGDIRMEDVPLCVMPADKLPKCHWVVVHVEKANLTAEETVKLFDRQNTGLVAKEWIIAKSVFCCPYRLL